MVQRKFNRHDSLDLESSKVNHHGHASKDANWRMILILAFQSIGVVFGDLGTSPLYVYSSTFPQGVKHKDDVIGVLSLIYYTLTLIPVIKYVFIVLQANDNGNGGTFALYSLLCRNVNVGLIPNQQKEDRQVANYEDHHLQPSNKGGVRTKGGFLSSKLQRTLENSSFAKYTLLFATILAVSLVIGDGVFTPCISVLSAVQGIKGASPSLTNEMVGWISVIILIFLFTMQRFGTDKVGYSFAPILCFWFVLNGCVGIYNFFKHDPMIIKALNPWQIVEYFKRNGKEAWSSLGGTILCITGTEALFADLGHFSVRSIQISMTAVVYPAILLQYSGQAAYLSKHPWGVTDAFYSAVPAPLYWPMFIAAVLAAIIASQAMISATFSIIHQSLALGCFPRVKVVHTSAKHEGQVYIPELNFLLMFACIFVTLGFGTGTAISNAYGIAVVFAETITSSFMILVMLLVWKTNILFALLYACCILSVELVYLSSVLSKFAHGGYLPIAFAFVLMTTMFVWNYAYRKTYYYEYDNKVSTDKVKEIIGQSSLYRVPGVAIFYSELVHGIPPIFGYYVGNVNAVHSVIVFTSIKSLHISKIPQEERFLFRRVDPKELMFRCVVRYGYTDIQDEKEGFENTLIERLVEFIKKDTKMSKEKNPIVHNEENSGENEIHDDDDKEDEMNSIEHNEESLGEDEIHNDDYKEEEMGDVEMVEMAAKLGVVHMMGESEVAAKKDSSLVKKLAIDYGYSFLKRNVRRSDEVFDIPRARLLKVGMTYEL